MDPLRPNPARRWIAREREGRRESGLEELRKIDEDTTIHDIGSLTRGDSPVRSEALAAIWHMSVRQSQAEKGLMYEYSGILPLLPEINVQPTPQVCRLAREYLQKQIAFQKKQFTEPSDSMLAVLQEGLPGIGWLAVNCDCATELNQLDDLAKAQRDSPAIQKLREALAGFRK